MTGGDIHPCPPSGYAPGYRPICHISNGRQMFDGIAVLRRKAVTHAHSLVVVHIYPSNIGLIDGPTNCFWIS